MIKNQIPNAITILSLILASLAIVLTFEGDLKLAAYLLIVSCACDYFDGFAARALKVNNPIGKEIDSLVDMVAFGVAPAMLLYQITKQAQEVEQVQLLIDFPWLHYLVFCIPVFSAIRLAKFNVDTRQTTYFYGLAVPAHAAFYIFSTLLFCFKADLPQVINLSDWFVPIISNPLIMLTSGVLLSFMLVAEVPMFSFKFKNMKWKDNALPFSFILVWFILFILTNVFAMPFMILMYILVSLGLKITKKSNSTSA